MDRVNQLLSQTGFEDNRSSLSANSGGSGHLRSASQKKFEDDSISTSSKVMRNALNNLTNGIKDEAKKASFEREMSSFHKLFVRFLHEKSTKISWDRINSPAEGQVIAPMNILTPTKCPSR
jgi:UDP-N-acetylglucosamine pyrophosphorylase